jgi:hypothetical protein
VTVYPDLPSGLRIRVGLCTVHRGPYTCRRAEFVHVHKACTTVGIVHVHVHESCVAPYACRRARGRDVDDGPRPRGRPASVCGYVRRRARRTSARTNGVCQVVPWPPCTRVYTRYGVAVPSGTTGEPGERYGTSERSWRRLEVIRSGGSHVLTIPAHDLTVRWVSLIGLPTLCVIVSLSQVCLRLARLHV